MKKFSGFVIGAFLLFFCASCGALKSVDMEINLKRADRWDVRIDLLAIGGETQQALIAWPQLLSEWKTQLAQSGVEMEWEQLSADRDGNTPYQVRMPDADPDLLMNQVFNNGSFAIREVNGQRQVILNIPVDQTYYVSQYTVTLKGRQVITSNGEVVRKGVVRWTNPTEPMRAVMLEGSPGISGGAVLLVLVGMLLAGGAYWYYQRSKSGFQNPFFTPPQAPVQVLQPASPFCPGCGTQMPANAQFCPKCGRRL
jgi:hypothetical protein